MTHQTQQREGMGGLPLKRDLPRWACPYCGKPVGIVGNWLAVWFGTGMHGCDFSNVAGGTNEAE